MNNKTMSDSKETALVSAYRKSSGSTQTTRGFGLNLGFPLRDLWVAPGVKKVLLKLEGHEGSLEVPLLDGFWENCPEFMHAEIYDWIVGQGLAIPWTKGQPHRFEMVKISGTEFSVRRLRHRAAS